MLSTIISRNQLQIVDHSSLVHETTTLCLHWTASKGIGSRNITGCSCLDFSASGDWCQESSGHQLCDETGMCGERKCALNDFQCKRKEYNTIYVPLKGYGGQCSSAMKIRLKWGVIALLFSSTLMAR